MSAGLGRRQRRPHWLALPVRCSERGRETGHARNQMRLPWVPKPLYGHGFQNTNRTWLARCQDRRQILMDLSGMLEDNPA